MRRSVLLIAGLLLLAGLLSGRPQVGQAETRAKPGAPRAAPSAGGDWPMYGANPGHTSANPAETAITPATVGRLAPAWQQPVTDGYTWPSSTPIRANGRVYVGGGLAAGPNFYAFDAQQGTPLWSTDIGHEAPCLDVGIGATPAISGSLLIAGGGDDAYYRLDPTSGAILWRHPLNVGPSGFPWASPVLQGNRAYIGVSSSCDNPAIRGEVRALDGQDGSILARQYLVPTGTIGADVWHSAALSPDGNTLVWTTGNDIDGTGGPYTRAIIAFDPLTLQIRGSDQEGTPNQDEDFNSSPTVFTDQQGRTLAVATHKDTYVYAYDLAALQNGPLWSFHQPTMSGLVPAYDAQGGAQGLVFFVTTDGVLRAFEAPTGAQVWASVPLGTVRGGLAVTPGLVFANTGVNGVQILDEATGTILRTLLPDQAGGANSGVIVSGGFVYWLSGHYLNAWSLSDPRTPTAPPGSPTPAPTCAFVDVCQGDYFYPAVQYLKELGAIGGYEDDTFRPANMVTRGQAMKILVIAFGLPPVTPPQPTFHDVPPGYPFFTVIETAAHAGLISGYADGTFHPDASITRAQTAKITVGAGGWPLVAPGPATFADVPPAQPFYAYIETAVCHGVLSGYTCGGPGEPCDGQGRPYFRPDRYTTRAQDATMIYHARTGPPTCPAVRPKP